MEQKINLEDIIYLSFDEAKKVLDKAGYARQENCNDDGCCESFICDDDFILYDDDDNQIDWITHSVYYNVIERRSDDMDDVEVVKSIWIRNDD